MRAIAVLSVLLVGTSVRARDPYDVGGGPPRRTPRVQVLYFHADWCGPCAGQSVLLGELATGKKGWTVGSWGPRGNPGTDFATIDVDAREGAADRMDVKGCPTWVRTVDGVEDARYEGILTKQGMADLFNEGRIPPKRRQTIRSNSGWEPDSASVSALASPRESTYASEGGWSGTDERSLRASIIRHMVSAHGYEYGDLKDLEYDRLVRLHDSGMGFRRVDSCGRYSSVGSYGVPLSRPTSGSASSRSARSISIEMPTGASRVEYEVDLRTGSQRLVRSNAPGRGRTTFVPRVDRRHPDVTVEYNRPTGGEEIKAHLARSHGFSLEYLNRLTYPQLVALHDEDHNSGRVTNHGVQRWRYGETMTVRSGTPDPCPDGFCPR